jgi:hypothetical protein
MIGEDEVLLLPVLMSLASLFSSWLSCSLRWTLWTLLPTSLPPMLPNDPAVPNSSDDSLRRRDDDEDVIVAAAATAVVIVVVLVVSGSVAETMSHPVVAPTPMLPPPPPDMVIREKQGWWGRCSEISSDYFQEIVPPF